ncbi:MAG: transcription antitermination factor NusB [Candidatus Latescibacteria bacterium 4484_7]|nr:MAG: transcription antitermination factor NusB [Candidatus Latescibacteria bacterium 4484_7]
MSKRGKAREIALQTLYAAEVSQSTWQKALKDNIARRKASEDAAEYAEKLVKAVMEEKDRLDEMISKRLENWELKRVSVVDKNILRIALVELLFCPEVPPLVIINEAIELARTFSSHEAGRFVNGILDTLAREVRGI